MATLNPYKITWAVFIPSKGKTTKKDLNIIYRAGCPTAYGHKPLNEILAHFPSPAKAQVALKKITGLTKPYKVVFITDKQFGLAKWNESLLNVATKKQLIETRIVQ
jgi:hypothetical protein